MRARKVFAILIMGFIVILVLKLDLVWNESPATFYSHYYGYDQEYERLLKMRKHAIPNSPEALRIEQKIKKIERRRSGYAKPEHPDEFVRILHEMKIPYGEKEPAYSLNYRTKELKKAKLLARNSAEILPWIERGPGNVSGRARGLIVDPADPTRDTWFVGSVGGGIWKTTNAGQTWIDLTLDFASLAVSSLAMSASNSDIMYAGTGESMYSVDVINGDGIYKSDDHGETWFQLSSTINNPNFNNISRILVDPLNPDIVIASTTTGRYKVNVVNESGIYKSIDGGVSWTEVYRETDIGGFGRAKKVLQIIDTPGNFNILYGMAQWMKKES